MIPVNRNARKLCWHRWDMKTDLTTANIKMLIPMNISISATISAGGTLLMQSGRDINLRAADVTATGDATLLAGNNLNLTSGEAVWDQSSRAKWTKHHFLSKTTHKIESETHQQSAIGSTVSDDTLKVMAGNDLTTSGSSGAQVPGSATAGDLTVDGAEQVSGGEKEQRPLRQ